jgi:hypothetical protein
MTAPLRWRSQLCPCGYCPDGTRIEWRYSLDIRFRPRGSIRKAKGPCPECFVTVDPKIGLDHMPSCSCFRARAHDVRKALTGSEAGREREVAGS